MRIINPIKALERGLGMCAVDALVMQRKGHTIL